MNKRDVDLFMKQIFRMSKITCPVSTIGRLENTRKNNIQQHSLTQVITELSKHSYLNHISNLNSQTVFKLLEILNYTNISLIRFIVFEFGKLNTGIVF